MLLLVCVPSLKNILMSSVVTLKVGQCMVERNLILFSVIMLNLTGTCC